MHQSQQPPLERGILDALVDERVLEYEDAGRESVLREEAEERAKLMIDDKCMPLRPAFREKRHQHAR